MSEEKKPGPRGELGKGTPGSRVKHAWRRAGRPGSLKRAARLAATNGNADAIAWLGAK